MSLRTRILDDKTDQGLCLTPEGGALVNALPYPPFGPQKILPFRQHMTDDGTASGSTDMLVNGLVTNQDFFVPAHAERDRYIVTISVLLADAGTFAMNEFGNTNGPLANGCQLFYDHQRFGRIDIHDAMLTNFDIVRLGFGEPAFGAAATTFRGTNFVGNAEAIMPIIDLRRIMPPFGIKLDQGSNQRLTWRIRDDLSSGLDAFDAIVYGFDRFE